MPQPTDLKKYVDESEKALGLKLDPQWKPAIAEHLGRLFDAQRVMEEAGPLTAEPATRFEP